MIEARTLGLVYPDHGCNPCAGRPARCDFMNWLTQDHYDR